MTKIYYYQFIVVIIMKVQCGVPEVEKEIEEKINEFITKVSKHPNRRNQVNFQINIVTYEINSFLNFLTYSIYSVDMSIFLRDKE